VFVHARKDTVRTAQALLELATKEGCMDVSYYVLLLTVLLMSLLISRADATAVTRAVAVSKHKY
jgi:hypothetical protein